MENCLAKTYTKCLLTFAFSNPFAMYSFLLQSDFKKRELQLNIKYRKIQLL